MGDEGGAQVTQVGGAPGEVEGGQAGGAADEEETGEVIFVNGKTVTVTANLHVKSKLSQFCQKLFIEVPKYQMYDVNSKNTNLRYFIAHVKADGKTALGTGRTKKMAQTVAARGFLNNIFLSGNDNSQARTPVCNPSVCPSKKLKQRAQTGKWIQKKEKLRAEEESTEMKNSEPENQNHQDGTEKAQEFIYFDLERSGGNITSEVIQIGYTDGQVSESINIQPRGGISKSSSKYSHKMTLSKSGKLISGGFTGGSCISEAAEKFLTFIKRKKEESGKDVCLVFYGGDDEICLLNNLALVRKDQELVENATSFLNFQTVIEDAEFKDVSISLTKIQPNKKNISQHLLGPKIDKELENSHNAAVDADLLRRVFEVYVKSWSKTVDLKPYTVPTHSSLQTAQMVIRKLTQKEIRKGRTYDFLTFNGWD